METINVTRIKIYKSVIIPTIFHNIETWSRTTKKEIKELELFQENIIKAICEQRQSTPYYSLLAELGIWPVEQQMEYKQILLLHNILNTNQKRLLKEVIEEQIKQPWKGCWAENIMNTCIKYKIEIKDITKYTKKEIKRDRKIT